MRNTPGLARQEKLIQQHGAERFFNTQRKEMKRKRRYSKSSPRDSVLINLEGTEGFRGGWRVSGHQLACLWRRLMLCKFCTSVGSAAHHLFANPSFRLYRVLSLLASYLLSEHK